MAFEDAFQFVLKHEGGYIDDPQDRGGSTNRGITIQTLSNYRGKPITDSDIRNLSIDDTRAIYRSFYWTPLKLDEFTNPKFQIAIFDQAVLCGAHIVVERLQGAMGVTIDGIIGPQTIASVNGFLDQDTLFKKFICQLQLRYCQICTQDPSQIKFLAGWLNRWQDLLFL